MLSKFGILSLSLVVSSLTFADTTPLTTTASTAVTLLPLQSEIQPIKMSLKAKPSLHKKKHGLTSSQSPKQYPQRVGDIPVDVKYQTDLVNQTELLGAISRVDQSLNGVNLKKTFGAQPIDDRFYNTMLFSSTNSPYVSMSLSKKIEAEKSCVVDTVGPCLIIEVDSTTGSQKTTAYHVFSHTDKADGSDVNVFRIPIDEKKYTDEIKLISKGDVDGIYVFSNAQTSQEAKSVDASLAAPDTSQQTNAVEAAPIPHSTFFVTSKGVHFENVSDTDERKREMYGQDVQKLIDEHTTVADLGRAPFNSCHVVANMVPQRRYFGVDLKSIPNMWRKVKSYSRVSHGAILTCYLLDGNTRQDIPVIIREHGIFRFGFVASKSSQKTLSWGLAGFLNSAVDALSMHDYIFPVRASAGFGPFQGALTPLVLSNQKDHDAIMATAPEMSLYLQQGFAANADVTIFGGLTIQADIPMGQYN